MPASSDVRRRGLAIAQLNPQSVIEIADAISGSPVGSRMTGRARKEAPRVVGSKNYAIATGGPEQRADFPGGIQRIEALGGGSNALRSRELS